MQPERIRRKWEPYVGRFVLAFTAIEHSVTIAIDLLSNKSISNTARTLLFNKRTELVVELLQHSENVIKSHQKRFIELLNDALKLSKDTRNILVHNHILLELYQISNDEKIYEREYIISPRNKNKKLSLATLKSASQKAEDLAIEISENYLLLVKDFNAK
jgi:hypothetical protein